MMFGAVVILVTTMNIGGMIFPLLCKVLRRLIKMKQSRSNNYDRSYRLITGPSVLCVLLISLKVGINRNLLQRETNWIA